MPPKFHRSLFLALCFSLAAAGVTKGADLAPTPPIGWNSWNHFHLKIDDAIIRAQARAIVTSGMKAAGYEYVVIDGGWEGYHDAKGVFHPNILKFPDMKKLCDYIHGLGLKMGIHTSPGPVTCSGREASYGHEQQDAETFANWGIDFVKYDWCSGSKVYKPSQMKEAYEKFHRALLRTGRPILYSLCQYGMQHVWTWGPSVGASMWRTTGDIQNNYYRMAYIGFEQNGLEKFAGPGHWNNPDNLEIGNGVLTPEESQMQMSLWSLLAAPLFAGNDLTKMSPETLAVLTDREVIAVDQDRAGVQGHRVWQQGPLEIWMKPLADGGKAVGMFNRDEHKMTITLHFQDIGIPGPAKLRNLWSHKNLGTFRGSYTASVPRHGVILLKVEQ